MTQKEIALRLITKAIKVNEKTSCCVDVTYYGHSGTIEFEFFDDKSMDESSKIYETFSLKEPDSEISDMIEEALDEVIKTGELPPLNDEL